MLQVKDHRDWNYVKQNVVTQWLPGYINYTLLRQIINAFKILTIVYKKFVHSNNQVTEEIDLLPQEEIIMAHELGLMFDKYLIIQRKKQDAFLQFKVFQLHADWRFVEQCWQSFKIAQIRSHDYNDKRRSLKLAIQTCYRNIYYVKSFIQVNQLIQQLLREKIQKYMVDFYKVRNYHVQTFGSRNSIQGLQALVGQSYHFLLGTSQDKYQLSRLVLNKNKITKVKNYFLLGMFLGFVIFQIFTLVITLELDVIDLNFVDTNHQSLVYVFPIFRGIALFIMYLWGVAWNVYGFTKFNINYRLILRLGNHYSTYAQIMKRAGFFTVLLLLMFMLYLIGQQYGNRENKDIPVCYAPFIVYFLFFTYMFFPSDYAFNPRGRRYLYSVLVNVIKSPFIPMTFLYAWATDQAVSFVGPLKDLAYAVCYYTSDLSTSQIKECLAYNTIKGVTIGYVVAVVPLFYRMAQCTRAALESPQKRFWGHLQMWNFFKYTSSVFTATFSFIYKFDKGVFWIFVACSVISTCYAYYWDLKYDWGFLQSGSKNKLLRDSLSYKSPLIYYFAIATNFVLRCSWTLSISSFVTAQINSGLLIFLTSFLEMYRRCMWNFFRIEKQHVANCGAFRTTDDARATLKAMRKNQKVRRDSVETDSYSRFDNNFEIRQHLDESNIKHQKHQNIVYTVRQTTDEMVKVAKTKFQKFNRLSQQFVEKNSIDSHIKLLIRAIGPSKMALARRAHAKIQVD